MSNVVLECGQCGKANKVETQFQISCGCCKAPLDTQAFRPYADYFEQQKPAKKSGVSKTTMFVVATVTAVSGFFSAEYVSQRAAVSPTEYRFLEACILGSEPTNHARYQRKVAICTCAFNQTRDSLAAKPELDFVATFEQTVTACAGAVQ